MGQNSSRWQRTSRRTTRSSVSCLGGSTSTTISTKWLQSKPVSGTYPINKLLWLRGTLKKKKTGHALLNQQRNDFEKRYRVWFSIIANKTYYPSNRNNLPLKILGLLFVKQNTFTLKTPCIPWQWRFREDVVLRSLAGVCLTWSTLSMYCFNLCVGKYDLPVQNSVPCNIS